MISAHPGLRLSLQDKESPRIGLRASPDSSSARISGERIMFKTPLDNKLRAAMLVAMTGLSAAYSASSSAADVFMRTTTASKTLSDTGAPVTLISVTIPAGIWVVTAKANPVNFGAADYV